MAAEDRSEQIELHKAAGRCLGEVKKHIVRLRELGPCPHRGDSALLNLRERLLYLADLTTRPQPGPRPVPSHGAPPRGGYIE